MWSAVRQPLVKRAAYLSIRSIRGRRMVRPTMASVSLQPKDIQDIVLRTMTMTSQDDTSQFDESFMNEQWNVEEPDAEELKRREADLRREELKNKTGRLWTDPLDLDDMLNSKENFDDLPDWSPHLVSRISQERVHVLPDKIPTLAALASLALPPPPPPHPGVPGHAKLYALRRKRAQYKYVLEKVSELAEHHISRIQALPSWEDKQEAVDELFEDIEFTLKEKEEILGKHPSFGSWVERALEEYLLRVRKESDSSDSQEQMSSSSDSTSSDSLPSTEQDASSIPVFMDCFGSDDSEQDAVPKILSPLTPNARGLTFGRMVEEWELSAYKTSKRIMLRQCTRQIARVLEGDSSQAARIYVQGTKGVGKTAALAAIVASARMSGSLVLYLPDGDQLHKNGFYLEPSAVRPGMFDLPVLSQNVCKQFLDSHKDDLKDFYADKATVEKYFAEEQLQRLSGFSGEGISLVDLLQFGADKTSFSPMCYSAALDVLMNQEQTPFLMVLDEFNCYFEPGHYFHAEYDEDVKRPVPYEQISLFKPALDAMAVFAAEQEDYDNDTAIKEPISMKRGAIIVATTESHAVARKITDALTANVKYQASNNDSPAPIHLIDVPRLSSLEVDHMLANYEATGVGKLRLDRGETVMNQQEVEFLRMMSGGVAQRLMNACIL